MLRGLRFARQVREGGMYAEARPLLLFPRER